MNKILDTLNNNSLFHEGTADQGNYGLMPYTVYDGITNYSHNQSGVFRGFTALTAGGWFNLTSGDFLMGVWSEPLNHCWKLYIDVDRPTFEASELGDDNFPVAGLPIDISVWNFIVGKYDSTEVAVFVNGVKYSSAATPTALYNSLAGFGIGADAEGNFPSAGKFSNCFVCQASVPDNQIHVLYYMSKHLYGK